MWEGKKPGRDALKVTSCSEDQLKDKFVTLQSNTGVSSPVDPQPQPSSSDEPVEQPAPTKDTPVVIPPVPSTNTTSKASLAPIRGNQKPTTTSKVVTSSATSTTKLSSGRGNTKTSSAPVVIETPAKGDSSPGDVCTGTGLKCSEDGASFYVCSSGSWVSMGTLWQPVV